MYNLNYIVHIWEGINVKNKTRFYITLFGGFVGAHKFYEGDFKQGILYLCTAGLFMVGYITDLLYSLRVDLLGCADTREIKKQQIIMENQRIEHRKMENEEKGVAYCPHCGSTSVQYVERRKQLSLGRAAVGTALINPLAGAVGAVTSKKYKGRVKCLKCGYEWKLGKR